MGNLFAELKRRHIYRVAAAYAVVAWVLLQLVNNLIPALNLPNSAATLVLVLLAVGFPIVLIFAWVRELAPADGAAAQAKTGMFDWALMGALVVVIVGGAYQHLAPTNGAGTAQQAGTTTGAANTAGISIAVLPFVNLSGDATQEFFSDGITEEITSALAKVPNLRVVGRTSAFEFKGQNKDLVAIGQALRATHLIEGSVRKAGDRVRITAQLIKSDDGTHLWTENYDRMLTDIFATQEDIAQAIAGALKVPLGLQQGDTLVRDRTKDLESYDQYLRAKALLSARGADVVQAINILEPLVARDPAFAPAWGLLSGAYFIAPTYSPELRIASLEEARRVNLSSLEKAEKAAREAIRLDTRNVEGYVTLAVIQSGPGKWAAAEDLFKQALALDPNEPNALHGYSILFDLIGRLKDSLNIREKLRTLEPFVPVYNIRTAAIMQYNGQHAASIPTLEAIPPDAVGGLNRNLFLARAYAAVGRYDEAADTLLAIRTNLTSRKSVEDAARLLRSAPMKVTAPQVLPELEGELNFVYAYVGAVDRVLDAPERSFEVRSGFSGSIWLPEFGPARRTERFKAFARKAGLVDYWRARGWPDLCRPMGADDFVCD